MLYVHYTNIITIYYIYTYSILYNMDHQTCWQRQKVFVSHLLQVLPQTPKKIRAQGEHATHIQIHWFIITFPIKSGTTWGAP